MFEISGFWLGVFGLFYFVSIFFVCLGFYKLNRKDFSELKNELRAEIVEQLSEDVRQEIYYSERELLFGDLNSESKISNSIKSHDEIIVSDDSVPDLFKKL